MKDHAKHRFKKKNLNKVIFIMSFLLSILIILLIVLLIIKFNKNGSLDNNNLENSDNQIYNTSDKFMQSKELEGFLIENIQFTEQNGISELVADVTNVTKEDKEAFLANVILYDNFGKEISRIPASIVSTKAR